MGFLITLDEINGPLAREFCEPRQTRKGPVNAWAVVFIDEFCPLIGKDASEWLGDVPKNTPIASGRNGYMLGTQFPDGLVDTLRNYHGKSEYRSFFPDIQDSNEFRVMTRLTTRTLLMSVRAILWDRYVERTEEEYAIRAAEDRKRILQKHGIGGAGGNSGIAGSPSIEGADGYLESTIEEANTKVLPFGGKHEGTLEKYQGHKL